MQWLTGGQIQQRAQGVRIEAGILVEQQLRLLRSTLTSGKRWPRASIDPSSEALSTTITASGCLLQGALEQRGRAVGEPPPQPQPLALQQPHHLIRGWNREMAGSLQSLPERPPYPQRETVHRGGVDQQQPSGIEVCDSSLQDRDRIDDVLERMAEIDDVPAVRAGQKLLRGQQLHRLLQPGQPGAGSRAVVEDVERLLRSGAGGEGSPVRQPQQGQAGGLGRLAGLVVVAVVLPHRLSGWSVDQHPLRRWPQGT